MININETYIDSLATNANAIKKGRQLANDGSFIKLNKSDDETIIFGECKGSGKKNYLCSADFIDQSNPVFRCNCPSKQFPCKHNLGLMYSFANEKEFTVESIPEDILEKREKKEKREKNKAEKKKTPKKKNKTAIKKKINAQLEGIELLDKIVKSILKKGFGNISKEDIKELNSQVKEIGNYYISGLQSELKRLTLLLSNKERNNEVIMKQIMYLKALNKEGKKHLLNRLEDEDLNLAVDSNIEELLGHAWKLTELEELGQFEKDANLIQLSFTSFTDDARGENIDKGIFMNLNTGDIQTTYNYRPIKRKSDPKGEYPVSTLLEIPTLYIYPGDSNPRIRWEEMIIKEASANDYEKAFNYAEKSYDEVVKKVKNYIKSPLNKTLPNVLLHYSKLGKIDDNWVIEDIDGKRLVLKQDSDRLGCSVLYLLNSDYMTSQAILVEFDYDVQTKRLEAYPLSIVNKEKIVRLTY
ncbi:hypothetical protein [Tepidibacter hydrothermalis]|uniref:SWIM-type domain-containing protein n=1 Tax=Tepidibacter hydrothermalis TaxID=3036126 RepID=A0ABY8E9W4_9FIRM|nr:hypothetical protein [Tepidibacter hydrothermalis]WFD09726.1 hypothetical protein P4S50_15215 [Tepidibacter hydrothermalis]